jgi:hypothetical protein
MNPTSSAIIDKKVVRFNTFNYGVDFFICRRKNLTNSKQLCSHYGFV